MNGLSNIFVSKILAKKKKFGVVIKILISFYLNEKIPTKDPVINSKDKYIVHDMIDVKLSYIVTIIIVMTLFFFCSFPLWK
jgi:hypothetical protein